MPDCLFCKIASRQIPSKIVFENEHVIAFRDIDPKAPSHILIIPKKHVATVMDIAGSDKTWWDQIPLAVQEICRSEKTDISGFRMVINCGSDAGQAVDHVHVHILGKRKLGWPPG